MAFGRRCDPGCESWPDDEDYKRCPKCGLKTTRFSNLTPLDEDEAAELASKLRFEHFYEVYDRKADPDRLIPDAELAHYDELYPNGRPSNADKILGQKKAREST